MLYEKYKKEIKEVLKNKRVAKRVKEFKLTNEQIAEALPILIDMAEDKEDGIKEYLTSFYVGKSGAIMRSQELSKVGKANEYKKNIVTLHLQNIDFPEKETFDKDDKRLTLVNKLAEYTKEDIPAKGLYIYGNTGVGKSFITKRFALLLARSGKKVAFVNVPELAINIKASFSNGYNQKDEQYDLLKKTEILFLDDLGAETIASWFRDEFLYPILSYRAEHGLTTFISSIYSIDELAKIEAKTSKSKYLETDKSLRLVNKIKILTKSIRLEGINRNY